MQEPLFARRRTYLVLFAFFVLLGVLALREEFGGKSRGVLPVPVTSQKQSTGESETADYKIEKRDEQTVFESGVLKLAVPGRWGLGVILYRPSDPNVILAMSNSVDLGGSTSIPVGVVRGKLQISSREYAVEFTEISEKDMENPASKFWEERKKTLSTSKIVKVSMAQYKAGDKRYISEEMRVLDTKNKVDASRVTYYRLVGEKLILAVEWSWEGAMGPSLREEIDRIMSSLQV